MCIRDRLQLSAAVQGLSLHFQNFAAYLGPGQAVYHAHLIPVSYTHLDVYKRQIRRIFREALEGSNTSQIARSLNDEGIPTPGQYFKSKHPDKKKFSNMSEKISWETVMVYNILKNLVYTGTLVSRKMKSCGVGSKKRVVNEPIIVEGTHEAIISKEDFELAQKVIRGGGRNPTRKQHDYPLKGLVRCGNCKRAMTCLLYTSSVWMRVMVSCGHQPNRPLSSGTRIRPIVATPPPAMSCFIPN